MSTLTKNQTKTFRKDYINDQEEPETIIAKVRHDDSCGNGHNTFAITGEVYRRDVHRGEPTVTHEGTGRKLWLSFCGCVHDEIREHFPELAPLLKWHLCSTDGPLHYIENTIWHASDKDCWGKRAGEPRAYDYYVQPAGGQGLLVEWPENEDRRILGPKVQKFRTREEAQGVADACGGTVIEYATILGEGKAIELDAARRSAIWPEATDDELTAPGLRGRLEDRLPGLLAEFQKAVESLGLVY